MSRKGETFIAANGQELPVADIISAVEKNIMKLAKRYSLSRFDCEDLSVECSTKVWLKGSSFDPEGGSLDAWTYRIVENHLKNRYKKMVRCVAEKAIDCDIFTDPARILEYKDLKERVDSEICNLNPRYARYIEYIEQGCSNQEISQKLGDSSNTVNTTKCRAIKSLAQKVGRDVLNDHGIAA